MVGIGRDGTGLGVRHLPGKRRRMWLALPRRKNAPHNNTRATGACACCVSTPASRAAARRGARTTAPSWRLADAEKCPESVKFMMAAVSGAALVTGRRRSSGDPPRYMGSGKLRFRSTARLGESGGLGGGTRGVCLWGEDASARS